MAYSQEVPAPNSALAAQGTSAPPAGKKLIYMQSDQWGMIPMYIDKNASPSDAEASFRQMIVPILAQRRAEEQKAATVEAANIPALSGIPGAYNPSHALIGAGQALNDWFVNPAKQLYNAATGNAGAEADRKAQLAAAAREYARLAAISPAAKTGEFFGSAAPAVAASLAVPELAPRYAAAIASRFWPQIANAAGQGAILNAIPEPGPGGSRAQNAVQGAVTAAALQTPFSALGKVAGGPARQITSPQQEGLDRIGAVAPGYNPTPYQLTGSPMLKIAERIQAFTPFSAGQIGARDLSNSRAISGRMGNILGMSEGSTFPTAAELAAAQDRSIAILDAAAKSKATVTLSPETKAGLAAIRADALASNTPPTDTIRTINKFLGDASPQLRPEIEALGPSGQAQAIAQMGLNAFTPSSIASKKASVWANGLPISSAQTVLSDLSQWSSSGDHLAGKAKSLLEDDVTAALNSAYPDIKQNKDIYKAWGRLAGFPDDAIAQNAVPAPGLGDAHAMARQAYGAIEAARKSIDPATGTVSTTKLANTLSTGSDVYGFGTSSNPRIEELADLARTVNAIPKPPPENSTTAGSMGLAKWVGLGAEALAGGGAALGLHAAGGGGIAPTSAVGGILGAMFPFLAANYGTRAYLSPAFAQYATGGIPTLGDIAAQAAAPIQGAAAGATQ